MIDIVTSHFLKEMTNRLVYNLLSNTEIVNRKSAIRQLLANAELRSGDGYLTTICCADLRADY